MSSIYLIVCVAMMLQASRAYYHHYEHFPSSHPYGIVAHPWNYVYSQSPRVPGHQFEGRVINRQQPSSYPLWKHLADNEVGEGEVESRLFNRLTANLMNAGFFGNRFGNNVGNGKPVQNSRPFSLVNKWIPLTVNPDFPSVISKFESCTTFSEEEGICVPGAACSLFGGRPSGSCGLKSVCCINAVSKCGTTITLNNTYWQPPVTLGSSCSLTIKLDASLVEQPKEIAQIRLDFATFSISQPNAEGNCAMDVFKVIGADNEVPAICGDNAGQHMYLNVPSRGPLRSGKATNAQPSREITLSFEFGASSTAARMWNIQISMLPKGASYLAPADCLQYFAAARGRISSFNWQDVETTTTRQLNNQNYNICFRTEEIERKRASEMCLSVCPVKNGGDAFSITTPTAATDPTAITVNAQAAADAAALVAAEEEAAAAQEALDTAQNDVTAAEEGLAAAQATLAEQEANLAAADATLAEAQAVLADAQAAVDAAGGNPTDAQTQAVTDAQAAVDQAQAARDEAAAAVNPAEVDAAQEALTAAQTTLADAETALTAAQENLAVAQTAATDSANAAAVAGDLASGNGAVGTVFTVDGGATTATCLYDYLLISGGRDATNVEADRYCGNQLNPAGPAGLAVSVPVCTPVKSFRMTYRTDGTEGEVVEGPNVIPAPADDLNTGFCLIYQEK
ncbi:uncharacterized protein LOC130689656 [Daphnia carinata]|uniref:uncharacterized protein LOC130689656 n=1 Tax=Daphnia carinata TaxID=120202 RepID=UPI00257AC725|nr:uncharacterized protein LOC130689656 [Daphnia carinata]